MARDGLARDAPVDGDAPRDDVEGAGGRQDAREEAVREGLGRQVERRRDGPRALARRRRLQIFQRNSGGREHRIVRRADLHERHAQRALGAARHGHLQDLVEGARVVLDDRRF